MLNNILIDWIKLPFRKEKELFSALYKILGFYPRNIGLYKMALMHKSVFAKNEKGKPLNNERLEFLGDAVLGTIVGHIVYNHFPNKREGFLTTTRSKLVKRDSLNRIAEEIGLTKHIVTNQQTHTHNSYIAGNAFEALVGAVYLDRGYRLCYQFVERRILEQLVNLNKVAYKEVNFKSRLLEWCQRNRVEIEFRLESQTIENGNSPSFVHTVMIEGINGGTGKGYSKKESQQLAAKETLLRLRRKPQFIEAVFAAKSKRTKMDENPVCAVPDLEAQGNPASSTTSSMSTTTSSTSTISKKTKKSKEAAPSGDNDFTFDTINSTPKSRDEIIAEAEAEAWKQ